MTPGARFRRARAATLLAVGVAVLALLAFAVRGLEQLNVWQREQSDGLVSTAWFMTQAQSHAARTVADVSRYAAGDLAVGRSRLETQFEVLWSRVEVLGGDSKAREWLKRAGFGDLPRELVAELEAAEPLLLALAPGGDPGLLRQRLELVTTRLGDLALALNQGRIDHAQRADRQAQRHFGRFRISLAVVVAAAGLLAALALHALRRQGQHLALSRAAERRAGDAERDLRSVIDAVPATIAVADPGGRWLFANRFFADQFGPPARAAARGPSPEPAPELRDLPAGAFVETAVRDLGGRERVLLATRVPIVDGAGSAGRSVAVALDITERKRAEERVRYLAEHDALTGLSNRACLMARLEAALARARSTGEAVALFLVDLDEFKDVNDTLGHAAGDRLLVTVAERLRGLFGDVGTICRLGGDEFALLWQAPPDREAVDAMAARLLGCLAEPAAIAGQSVRVSGSVGIALAPEHGDAAEALLRHADVALYAAKRAGRRCARPFDGELAAQLQRRKRLIDDLRRAIDGDGLRLEYQPKYAVRTGRLTGFEALLRWDHPELGPVAPGEFVPLAEEAGLIGTLGDWVTDAACRQLAIWGPQLRDTGLTVAINLSAAQLAHGDVVAAVDRATAAAGADPRRLEVEVTESLFVKDAARAGEIFARLRQRGIRVAIDDFGTGFSSLSYLVRLPFDVLKIDRSFVAAMGQSDQGLAVVRAIVDLATSLGARVVAEGVETAAQLALLDSVGCDEAQGWLLGRPRRAEAIPELFAQAEPRVVAFARARR